MIHAGSQKPCKLEDISTWGHFIPLGETLMFATAFQYWLLAALKKERKKEIIE